MTTVATNRPSKPQDLNQRFSPPDSGGHQALQFLDSERQNFARSLSEEQKEDAAKATGMGLTFGVMKGVGDSPPEGYGEDILRRADAGNVPEAVKPVLREFGQGGAVRRFARPFLGAGLATYVGSRVTDNLLGEEEIYKGDGQVDQPQFMQGRSPSPKMKQAMDKSAAGGWVDDMVSFFRRGSDDVDLPDDADAMKEMGSTEGMSPREVDEAVENKKREMQLDEAGDAVESDTGFQMRRSWDNFKNEVGKYTPDLNVRGTAEAIGGAGILGGAGLLGNYGYRSTQPDVMLTPGQRRRQNRVESAAQKGMSPAGPLAPQVHGSAQKQASIEKTAEPAQDRQAVRRGIGAGAGLGALGAGLYGAGQYGDNAIRQAKIMTPGGFQRLSEFTDIDPHARGARDFMREYMQRGSRVMGEDFVDLPAGMGRLSGAGTLESVRDLIPDSIRKNVLGRYTQLFAGDAPPDDIRHRHYRSFAEGPAQAAAQIQGDLAATGEIEDPYGTFQRDIGRARNQALQATLEGEGGFDRRAFVDNLGQRFADQFGIEESEARSFAETVEDRMYRSDPESYQRYFQNAVESDEWRAANNEQTRIIDELYGGSPEPGGDAFSATQQNLVDKAQNQGFRGVESFEDIKGMSRDDQMKLLNAEGSPEDVYQQYGELKAYDDFKVKPRTYDSTARKPAQEAMNSIEMSARNFAEETAPKLKGTGKGLMAVAPLAAAGAYYASENSDEMSKEPSDDEAGVKNEKTAGGPGSGKSRDSTETIKELEKSPLITLHKRKDVIEHRGSDRETDISLDEIEYGAQSTYDVEKLGWMLSNPDEWEEEPIQVARINGDYHLMDGHHRFLAAIRLAKSTLPAEVWVMDEREVRRITGQKTASFTNEELEKVAIVGGLLGNLGKNISRSLEGLEVGRPSLDQFRQLDAKRVYDSPKASAMGTRRWQGDLGAPEVTPSKEVGRAVETPRQTKLRLFNTRKENVPESTRRAFERDVADAPASPPDGANSTSGNEGTMGASQGGGADAVSEEGDDLVSETINNAQQTKDRAEEALGLKPRELAAGGVAGGTIGLGLGGYEYFNRKNEGNSSTADQDKEAARIPGPLAGAALGGLGGVGTDYLRQKARIYNQGGEGKINPYSTARAGLIGASLGAAGPIITRRADDLISKADDTIRRAEGVMGDVEETRQAVTESAKEVSETARQARGAVDEAEQAGRAVRDTANKARNNRFFGLFSKESEKKEASARSAVADAFVDWARRTESGSPEEFRRFLSNNTRVRDPEVRTRPSDPEADEMNAVHFSGEAGGPEMFEVRAGDQSFLVPGVDNAGENLRYHDRLSGMVDDGRTRELGSVTPVSMDNAIPASGPETEFSIPLSETRVSSTPDRTELANNLLAGGVLGGGGYALRRHQKGKDPLPDEVDPEDPGGIDFATGGKNAADRDTITVEADTLGEMEFGFDFSSGLEGQEMDFDFSMPEGVDVDLPNFEDPDGNRPSAGDAPEPDEVDVPKPESPEPEVKKPDQMVA